MNQRLNNYDYKIFLIILKVLPFLLSFIYFIEIILDYIKIDCSILSLFGFTSILPLIFLYASSYVFRFCVYHRMFLHYVGFITIYNAVDLYYKIPLNRTDSFATLMIITFIFMVITLYRYLKDKKGGKLWQ